MNLPSVKTLKLVFGDHAKEARELLENKREVRDYESVQELERACYYAPSYHERLMVALNEIAGTHGDEYIPAGHNAKSPSIHFLNTGDLYDATFMIVGGHSYRVGCVADIIERGKYD